MGKLDVVLDRLMQRRALRRWEEIAEAALARFAAEEGRRFDGLAPDVADLFRRSSVDGWDRPIRLVREDAKWDLVSDGPDGVAGNADDVKSAIRRL